MHSRNYFWDQVFTTSGLSASMAISHISQNASVQPSEKPYNPAGIWLVVTHERATKERARAFPFAAFENAACLAAAVHSGLLRLL